MRLPRRIYLAAAGLETEMFKSIQRRVQVPRIGASLDDVLLKSAEEIDAYAAAGDQRGYLAEEALLMALADHLVCENSFTRTSAKRIVCGHLNVLAPATRRVQAGEEIWLAVGSWDFGHDKLPGEDEPTNRAAWGFVEAGTFDEVIASVRAEHVEKADQPGRADNIALTNLSLIVRRTRERAKEVGVELSFFEGSAS